jgi:hypothetical protein
LTPIVVLRFTAFPHIGATLSIADVADRAPRVLADGETISIGKKQLRWFDAPHLPHNFPIVPMASRPKAAKKSCAIGP